MRGSESTVSRQFAASRQRKTIQAGTRKERAFLVGLDYHKRSKGAGGKGKSSLTSGAQAARDNAAGSSAGSISKVPTIPEFSAQESLDELRSLATSAGAEIAGEFLQHRDRPDPATLIGKGKLEEISAAAASVSADLLLFDHDLTASQQRNIEKVVHTRVIDRTQLILDIFAKHARTREGQLQVELAQLDYMLPRLGGRGIEMSQLGGGIGTRGPGETQLETDRRKIYRRIRHVKEQIENVRRVRAQQRQRREAVPVATVALVGYTNAGKSTLFNVLTQAAVLESPRMFATLDPTIRAVMLPSKRKVLLSDTVGFIRNLPHTLVSAFRATLEEVQRAALVIHVSDASSPLSVEQDAQVDRVLKELEVGDKPRLLVMNKIDLLSPTQRESLRDDEVSVHISAAKDIGISTLLERIDEMLSEDAVSRVVLRMPQQEGKLLALLEARSRIYSRNYKDGLVELEVEAPDSIIRRVRDWVVGVST
ncbi:MAG: GTP-binding protein HSR1-related protein [Acidobacteriaceae bacterium]|nr:GTP-binding protein HSR1-related protein [Acidobacteriaceae bacterium]